MFLEMDKRKSELLTLFMWRIGLALKVCMKVFIEGIMAVASFEVIHSIEQTLKHANIFCYYT